MNNPWETARDSIHAEEELKEHTREYLAQKVYARRRRPFASPLVRLASCAACLVLLLLGGGYLYLTPTAFISIDVNPSLELGINRFDRVVTVEGYNPEGEAIAASLDIRFLNYQDALEQILADPELGAYLAENEEMNLTVASSNTTQGSEILQNMEDCVSGHENVHCHQGNSETMEEAHSAGLSFGKYQAYLILRELDPSVTLEEVQGLSMREIREWIQQYEDAGETLPDLLPGEEHHSESDYSSGEEHNLESGCSYEEPEASTEESRGSGEHHGGEHHGW